MKFSACREDKSVYTEVVEKYLPSIISDGVIDVDEIDQIVEKIEIAESGDIIVHFINGITISNNKGGDSDGCGT